MNSSFFKKSWKDWKFCEIMNSQNRFHKEYGPVMPWQCKSHSLNTTYMGPLWAFYEFDFLRSEQGMN